MQVISKEIFIIVSRMDGRFGVCHPGNDDLIILLQKIIFTLTLLVEGKSSLTNVPTLGTLSRQNKLMTSSCLCAIPKPKYQPSLLEASKKIQSPARGQSNFVAFLLKINFTTRQLMFLFKLVNFSATTASKLGFQNVVIFLKV